MWRPVLAGLLLATAGAAPAVAAPDPFQRQVGDAVRPIGFAGDAVIADDVRGLVAIRRTGAPRRLVARRDIRRSAVSDQRLAIVVGGRARPLPRAPGSDRRGRASRGLYDPYVRGSGGIGGSTLQVGPRRTLVGPPQGPLTEVARCPALNAAELTPAVSGDVVAWRDCDPTRIGVDRPAGRATVQADGSVAAIAVDGSRVAWVATHDADTPSTLGLTDLDAGTTTVVSRLLPAPAGDEASVALLGDRILAVVPDARDPFFPVCARSAGPVTGPLVADGDDCSPAELLPGGSVGFGTGRTLRTAIAFHPTAGKPVTLARIGGGVTRVVGAGDRVAVSETGCRRSRLIVTGTAPRRAMTTPTCPVRLLPGPSRVGPDGLVRFRLVCRNGCRLPRQSISLEGGRDSDGAIDALRGVDVPRRGSARVAFRLPPEVLRAVREGRQRSRGWFAYRPDGEFVSGRVRFRR